MPTLVFVHAHPDDEASLTSGSMALAAASGSRVVVVYATGGEHGEVPDDLAPGERVADRRRVEAHRSAEVLGVHEVIWLGYTDSGMTGWAQNREPTALAAADPDAAASRLVAILDAQAADVVVGYDWHGNYGHPDHIAVHRLVRAATGRTARPVRLLEATMNRDLFRQLYQAAVASGLADDEWDPDRPLDDGIPLGMPASEIQWQVDVSAVLPQRRLALQAHASQATDIDGFLSMPDEVFATVFGVEHYLEPGRPDEMRRGWPFG